MQPSLAWFTSDDISLQQYRTVLNNLHQKAVNVFLHVSNRLASIFHLCLQPDHHLYQAPGHVSCTAADPHNLTTAPGMQRKRPSWTVLSPRTTARDTWPSPGSDLCNDKISGNEKSSQLKAFKSPTTATEEKRSPILLPAKNPHFNNRLFFPTAS